MKLAGDELERVARMFRAFGEATRLAIVQELKGGELSVSEIVAALGATQTNVSKQLRILHEAGVVARRKLGRQVRYALADAMVLDLCKLVCDKLNRDARRPPRLRF